MNLVCNIRELQKLDFTIYKLLNDKPIQFLLLYNGQLLTCQVHDFDHTLAPVEPNSIGWDACEANDMFLSVVRDRGIYLTKEDRLLSLKKLYSEVLLRCHKIAKSLVPDDFVNLMRPILYDVTFVNNGYHSDFIAVSESDSFQVLSIQSLD